MAQSWQYTVLTVRSSDSTQFRQYAVQTTCVCWCVHRGSGGKLHASAAKLELMWSCLSAGISSAPKPTTPNLMTLILQYCTLKMPKKVNRWRLLQKGNILKPFWLQAWSWATFPEAYLLLRRSLRYSFRYKLRITWKGNPLRFRITLNNTKTKVTEAQRWWKWKLFLTEKIFCFWLDTNYCSCGWCA